MKSKPATIIPSRPNGRSASWARAAIFSASAARISASPTVSSSAATTCAASKTPASARATPAPAIPSAATPITSARRNCISRSACLRSWAFPAPSSPTSAACGKPTTSGPNVFDVNTPCAYRRFRPVMELAVRPDPHRRCPSRRQGTAEDRTQLFRFSFGTRF